MYPQLSACSESYTNGRVIEAHYTLENDTVTLVDADGDPVRDRWGNPIRKRSTGDDHRAVASRLALGHHRDTEEDDDDFNRPLRSGISAPY
ncbi:MULTISPECIES: hypothetical protein [unclassified Bradyrhizobium]|uniref:hypothetical protein n=1 Tax=unclassified Bradyrhizobium TaxID=2631580 RepID=UPI0028EE2CB6|nr:MULTISPECIES: hypothetical protein [unclassified Bradyrhizobium]